MVAARIKYWMERFLEEPFYMAELRRAEILKEEQEDNNLMNILVDALSHNYDTIKSWSR